MKFNHLSLRLINRAIYTREVSTMKCKECNGKGSVKCPSCKGKGQHYRVITSNFECKHCNGSGVKNAVFVMAKAIVSVHTSL